MKDTKNAEFHRALEACFPLMGLNSLLENEEIKEISSGLKMVYSQDCAPTFAHFDHITAEDIQEEEDLFEDITFSINPELELLMTKKDGVLNCIYKY